MGSLRITALIICAVFMTWAGTPGSRPEASERKGGQEQSTRSKQNAAQDAPVGIPALPRGKKLVLKDGSFQLVRDYQRLGERVRYMSAERGGWEEIPASLVDWDATAKAAAAEQAEEEAVAKKIRTQEQAQNMQPVMDVDASLQVAPGVFLPSGEGMFLIDGKYIMHLEQVGTETKRDKMQTLKQVLSPIPIVSAKQNVQIPGSHSTIRIKNARVEFYLREVPTDAERDSAIVKSSRPGDSGPEVELVRATVKGNSRQLESIRTLFGQELEQKRTSISMLRWDVAPTVYRFTLSESLPPGEYALAELLPDGLNLYVWDFGVDAAGDAKPSAVAKTKN
jgi:hypothetical protein